MPVTYATFVIGIIFFRFRILFFGFGNKNRMWMLFVN